MKSNIKNLIYVVTAVVLTIGAVVVWQGYFQLDDLGLTPAQREAFEEQFIVANADTYTNKYEFELDITQLNQAEVGEAVEIPIVVESEYMPELAGVELVFEYDPQVVNVSAIENGEMFDYYFESEPEKEGNKVAILAVEQSRNYSEIEEYVVATLTVERVSDETASFRLIGGDYDFDNIVQESKVVELNEEAYYLISALYE